MPHNHVLLVSVCLFCVFSLLLFLLGIHIAHELSRAETRVTERAGRKTPPSHCFNVLQPCLQMGEKVDAKAMKIYGIFCRFPFCDSSDYSSVEELLKAISLAVCVSRRGNQLAVALNSPAEGNRTARTLIYY